LERNLSINAFDLAFLGLERTHRPATGTTHAIWLNAGESIHVNLLDHPRDHLPDIVSGPFNQNVMGNLAAFDETLFVIQLDFEFRQPLGRFRNFRLQLMHSIVHDRSSGKKHPSLRPQTPAASQKTPFSAIDVLPTAKNPTKADVHPRDPCSSNPP
jgi:hypothetical protein